MNNKFYKRSLNYTSGLLNENSKNNIIFMKTLCVIWDTFDKELKKIHNLLDLNKCFGEDLDNFGKNWQIYRDGRSDIEYRKWIKAYRAFKTNKNDRNTILNIISVGLDVDKKNIQIYESSTLNNRPCIIEISITEQYSLKRLLEISNMIKAAGISIVIRNDCNITGIMESSYANFIAESFEYIQDVRRFREINNKTNYGYSTMVSDNVEYKQERI